MTNNTFGAWVGRFWRNSLLFAVPVLLVWGLVGTPLGRNLLQSWLFARTNMVSSTPIIVTKLQALNRLETASQVSSSVVTSSADRAHLPGFLGQDRVLMQIQTETIAGIDMTRLTAADVVVQGKGVTVRVPAPELFSVRIDDENSKVFSRERGWLVCTPDINLESQARLKVLADTRATSKTYLLPTARTNAETNLRQLLATVGFETVKINWADQV